MLPFWIKLAKIVVPFLLEKAVLSTETKVDDELLEVVKEAFLSEDA